MPKIDLKGAFGKKIGPLPAWGWAVAIGGGILVWRMTKGGGGGATGSPFAFEPSTGFGSGGGSGGGGGIGPITLPDNPFEPSPTPNAGVQVPGTNNGGGSVNAPISFPSFPTISLPSFGGISDIAIPSAGIAPIAPSASPTMAQQLAAKAPIASTFGGATFAPAQMTAAQFDAKAIASAAARTAGEAKQAVPVASPNYDAKLIASAAARTAGEAKQAATKAAATAAKPVLKMQTSSIVSKPKPVPTTRKAPTAVTPLVASIAGPNLRGGTRL